MLYPLKEIAAAYLKIPPDHIMKIGRYDNGEIVIVTAAPEHKKYKIPPAKVKELLTDHELKQVTLIVPTPRRRRSGTTVPPGKYQIDEQPDPTS